MRIFFIISILFITSACTPEIYNYIHNTKQNIVNYNYTKTLKDFVAIKEVSPTIKQQQATQLKIQCANYSQKRVRYISGVNDEAWYDKCPSSMYPELGPERLELTKRPPYSKSWSAVKVNPNLK